MTPACSRRFGQHEWEVTDNLLQGWRRYSNGDAQAMLAELYQLQYPLRNNQLVTSPSLSCPSALASALPSGWPVQTGGVLDQSPMTINDTG